MRAGDQHDASGIVKLAVAKKAAMAEALTIMMITTEQIRYVVRYNVTENAPNAGTAGNAGMTERTNCSTSITVNRILVLSENE